MYTYHLFYLLGAYRGLLELASFNICTGPVNIKYDRALPLTVHSDKLSKMDKMVMAHIIEHFTFGLRIDSKVTLLDIVTQMTQSGLLPFLFQPV